MRYKSLPRRVHKTIMASKRKRKTLNTVSYNDVCDTVRDICLGTHKTLYIQKLESRVVWYGKTRRCWRLKSRAKKPPKHPQLYGSNAYQSFFIYSIWEKRSNKSDFDQQRLKLPLVSRTSSDDGQYHVGHRCGDEYCINPKHLYFATPTENEMDKHYHWIMHSTPENMEYIHYLSTLGEAPESMVQFLTRAGPVDSNFQIIFDTTDPKVFDKKKRLF